MVSHFVCSAWLSLLALPLAAVPASARGERTAREQLGPRFDLSRLTLPASQPHRHHANAVEHWNALAIDASGLDHTPPAAGESRAFGEQLGPGRSSRAMAIVHVAIFEAVNAIAGGRVSYVGLARAPRGASQDAAIAQAAHDTLVAVYPSQAASFEAELETALARVRDRRARALGASVGSEAARLILAKRASDGSDHDEPRMGGDYVPGNAPGEWRQDPISQIPIALGAHWGAVEPFAISSAADFRTPPPPALGSAEYALAFGEVQALGGDGVTTPTLRTREQTEIGIYWAYDGTPSLCAPPRLYNQIALQIARQRRTSLVDLARLLALVNVAMADAGVAAWESKYFHHTWRPVAGIREADAGTGPSGLGDGNPDTQGDATFSPLGAPASNLTGPNFTPPFPAYPSGHATFGGALFQTLRRFYGRDDIAFSFVSDELNGVTKDNAGNVRPLVRRSFASLSQAEEENGQSRIYLGIHWSFDKTAGIAQGRAVADAVFDGLFARSPRGR
jgi:hypothetical protein